MIITLLLFTIIVSYVLLSWLWQILKRGERDPPLHPGILPVIGHAHHFLGDTVRVWKALKNIAEVSLQNGGVTIFKLGTQTTYILTDPEDCMLIGNACLDKGAIYDIAKPWLGEGLVTAPVMEESDFTVQIKYRNPYCWFVDIWKRHRKIINPTLRQHVLDEYMTVFNAQSRRLAEKLQKEVGKAYFNHEDYVKRTSLKVICLTATGIEDKDELLENEHYMDAVDEIFNLFVVRIKNVYMINDTIFKLTALKRRQDDLVKILHDMSNKIIQKRKAVILNAGISKETLKNTPKRFKSFLNLLLESSLDGSLTDSEIREEVDTIVGAGYDSSATLMTYALVMIGSYPEVQEKVFEELQDVFEGSDRDVEKHDLPKLVYLEAVLKEVLRFYPVVPIIARYLKHDVQLKNYTLRAGNSCWFLINGIHRHSVWGPDRMQFKPDRWLNPSELPDLPNAFFGFGVGRRSCIGARFVYMSAKTTLCHVLRRYRITADHTKMVLKFDILLKPEKGHHIKIEARSREE